MKFTAKTPTPFDRLLSATDATYIFSPATKGMKPEDWTGKSFGTGPYMIESYKLGEEYVFVRNPNWWGEWQARQSGNGGPEGGGRVQHAAADARGR